MNICQLIEEKAKQFPEKIHLFYGTQRVSYGEYWEHIQSVARAFQTLGLQRSDIVAIMLPNCMEHTVDARGLACPLPLVKARAALASLGPGDELVVLATDPESPIDLAALAADHGLRLTTSREVDHWRLVLTA